MSFEYKNNINLPPYDLREQGVGYNWLKDQNDIDVVAYLPVVDPLDEVNSTYSTMQIFHNKKMINIKNPENRTNANILGSIENKEAIDWIYQRGAQVAVVHFRDDCPVVEWGVLKIQDKWRKTCIYRINQKMQADEYFIRFDTGVDPTPNFDINQKNTYRPNSDQIVMSVVDGNFKRITQKENKAHLKLIIDNWNNEQPVEGFWRVYQSGKIVTEGKIGTGFSSVEATVDPQKEVKLVIDRPNKGNDLLLRSTSVAEVQ